ncbi:arabinofuranan 3-O-arabinosyltransferase [Kitasatospora sp. MAA4]|uniref:glycosyltransferase family 87 protein n=1 Tax=Kitasatospora sp. MAA4 TaxID=3035093 RepID=UPI002474F2DF|nr:glycosyltransferase family 87 protein [Kitasatospora sp. MAA4]MDH6131456.1 arabinofuranan 3-O-arabinosyltransferase [Kitasatospora sp. MAA4]
MGTRRSAIPDLGPWLRARAPLPLLVAVLPMLWITVVNAHLTGGWNAVDDQFIVKAAQTFRDGGAPYADKRFLYFPSAVLVALPQSYLSGPELKWVAPIMTVALVVGGWLCALRLFRVPLLSRLSALGILLLCFLVPFRNVVQLGNWTAYSALALPAALLLAHRSRWVWAGLVIGLAIATKPMLVPVAVLFLIARRPIAFLVSAAVPLAASLAAAAMMPQPGLFFTKTLPFLLHGQDVYARPFDASLGTLLPRLGVPHAVALGLAGILAVALVAGAWRRWRLGGDEALRLTETAAMLMLAALIASRPSFDHYLLVVLPMLTASLVRPGSAARSWWIWVALVPKLAGFTQHQLDPLQNQAYSVALVNVVLTLVLLRRVFVDGRGRSGEDEWPMASRTPAEERASDRLEPSYS